MDVLKWPFRTSDASSPGKYSRIYPSSDISDKDLWSAFCDDNVDIKPLYSFPASQRMLALASERRDLQNQHVEQMHVLADDLAKEAFRRDAIASAMIEQFGGVTDLNVPYAEQDRLKRAKAVSCLAKRWLPSLRPKGCVGVCQGGGNNHYLHAHQSSSNRRSCFLRTQQRGNGTDGRDQSQSQACAQAIQRQAPISCPVVPAH